MYKKYALLISMLAVLPVLTVLAQEMPPEGGTPKDFNIPEKTTFTLDNGMKATLVPYGALPKVTVRVVLDAGNINEAADQVWLADLVGDLMKEGTTSRSASQIAEEAAQMGGSVNIGVGPDRTNITGDVLSEFGPDIVALIADILMNPQFPEDELDRLKRDRLRQLSIQKSQPGTIALSRFREAMYGDHPYGRLFPTEAIIEGYTVADIQDFFEAHFGAGRAHIYVAGKFNKGAVERAIREAFEDWPTGTAAMPNAPSPTAGRAVHIADLPGAAQSNVYIGLPVIDPSHPDYLALQVTNSLLGGSFASRITSNIREDKGYTYSPYSSVSSRYRDAYWAQVAAITTSVTGPAITEIFAEINRLQEEAPPAEELEGIQNYLAGTFVLQNSSRGGIIGQLAYMDFHGLTDDYLKNYVQNVYAITPEKVREITEKYLRDEEMMIVIAGDREAIATQVAPFEAMPN